MVTDVSEEAAASIGYGTRDGRDRGPEGINKSEDK
jgi:hypothetical protein